LVGPLPALARFASRVGWRRGPDIQSTNRDCPVSSVSFSLHYAQYQQTKRKPATVRQLARSSMAKRGTAHLL
jgi:hypothetical protein